MCNLEPDCPVCGEGIFSGQETIDGMDGPAHLGCIDGCIDSYEKEHIRQQRIGGG